jgi:hypothetical protein
MALAGCASTGTPQGAAPQSAAAEKTPVMSTPSLSKEECLFASVVDDWSPIDDERLLIYGPGRRQAFLATLAMPTSDLRFGFTIAIIDGDNNGRICGHGSDAIVIGGSAIPGRNTIISLQRIENTEADAMVSAKRKVKEAKPKEDKAGEVAAPTVPATP